MLVDSHCHLNYAELLSNLKEVIKRAQEAGVSIMQTICTKFSDMPAILEIAEHHPNIFASIGVHPHEAGASSFTVDDLLNYAKHPKVTALGETGLDFYYEHSEREVQKNAFLKHIEAARISKLPVVIHSRSADRETIDILQSEMKNSAFTGLIHCFSTGEELAHASIELGFYISISGIITFKKSSALQEIVSKLPLSSLLVETDSPYLAPVPHRGKSNEPAYTKLTAEFLAKLLNKPYEEVARVTTDNYFKLFSKARPQS
jgi:TatD DNase family protein